MRYNTGLLLTRLKPTLLQMAASKTYLNVPYAQKDAAKALGAKWDAVRKKWYVSSDKDLAPFAKWQTEPVALAPSSSAANKSKLPIARSGNKTPASNAPGIMTHAADKDFVAYDGDEPPWD
jgi:hypothetical protein